jgi:hypothetical protein
MTPDAVAQEILCGTKDRQWVIRCVPRSCRVQRNTRPPLFWERLTPSALPSTPGTAAPG